MDTLHFTGLQLRAARGLLRITSEQLARMAGVSPVTIRRAEQEDGPVTMSATNVFAVQRALDAAGVVFVDAEPDVGGFGVRMKWGASAAAISADQGSGKASGQNGGDVESRAWDDEDFDAPAMPEADRASLGRYYEDHPDRWAKLSKVGKAVLERAMRPRVL